MNLPTETAKLLAVQLINHPEDQILAGLLCDSLQDAGKSYPVARRMTFRIIREAQTDKRYKEACQLATVATTKGGKLRNRIRTMVSCRGSKVPIIVVSGTLPPRLTGVPSYHTFRNNACVVRMPGSAIKAGKKIDFHPDTRVITIGSESLIAIWEELN